MTPCAADETSGAGSAPRMERFMSAPTRMGHAQGSVCMILGKQVSPEPLLSMPEIIHPSIPCQSQSSRDPKRIHAALSSGLGSLPHPAALSVPGICC